MKIVAFFLATACSFSAAIGAENHYDVFAKTLMPFVSVFSQKPKVPNRAFSLKLRLEQMTALPPALAGANASIAIQYPDRLWVHGPFLGESITLCRNRQELWAFPGAKLEALLNAADLPKAPKKDELPPFALPFPEKQLVFLPALFQVQDAGSDTLDGETCRVLNVRLMSELEKQFSAAGWVARIWIRSDYRPARISLARQGWSIVVRVENVTFAPSFPEEQWQPSAEEAGDVLKLRPAKFLQLLQGITGSVK